MRTTRGIATLVVMGALLALGGSALGGGEAAADPIYKIDYADYDVRLTDQKNVVTDATDFGFLTGANILYAKRGSSKVDIPFRRIRKLEISAYLPSKGYSPAKVTTKRGKTYDIQIERFEGRRYVGGNTDFGNLRVRMLDLKVIEFKRLSHTGDDFGGSRP